MKLFAAVITLVVSITASADVLVIDVRRNIPLSDDEPTYKDFYINAGAAEGLKKNLVVTAVRKWGVRDTAGTQSYGDIEVPVGQLRILAVFGKVAVAREYKLLSRDEHPMLEQVGIMNGDRIELKGSFVDDKPIPKRKVSGFEVPTDEAESTASLSDDAEESESHAVMSPQPPPSAIPASAAAPEATLPTPATNTPSAMIPGVPGAANVASVTTETKPIERTVSSTPTTETPPAPIVPTAP